MDAPPPTAPTAERPVRTADGRTRTALVLLVLALVLPMALDLVAPPVLLGDPLLLLGALATAAAALAVCAAAVAPVSVGPRAAVAAVALVNGSGGLLLALDAPVPSLGAVSLVSALTVPLQMPALVWLGVASASGLGERVRRSWRASLLVAVAVAGLQLLLSAIAIGTYGAAFRFTGGFEAYVLVSNVLATAGTVVTLHLVVSVVRTWRALDGAPVVPAPRPWLLALALTAAAALAVVTALRSGVL